MNRQSVVMGWDIGGAHLKAAVANRAGLVQVYCVATPVWQGVEVIERAINDLSAQWSDITEHRVTMTAELADIFPNRDDGVRQLIELVQRCLGHDPVRYLDADTGLCDPAGAAADPHRIASANWLASVRLVASQFERGVIVDVGTTTTDVTCFADGSIAGCARSDLQRSREQTLLYLGVVRTPVCAWVDEIAFAGHRQGIAAELFANAADVYRILGRLPEHADQGASCDGRGKSWEQSCDRIARMLLTDRASHDRHQWLDVCGQMAEQQASKIEQAIVCQLRRHGWPPQSTALVGAGVGRFVLAPIAEQLGMTYREPQQVSAEAIDNLPAAALALWPETAIQGATSK